MSTFAIILVIISAGLHAAWNLLSKKQHPSTGFMAVSMWFSAMLLLPLLVYFSHLLPLLSPAFYAFLLLTGLFETFYLSSLAAAYRHGDMSLAYPLARSAPLLVVTCSALLLGRGEQISWMCIAGIIAIVAGSLLLPMKRFSDFAVANYKNKMCLYSLCAAIGTAGYSLVDDHLLKIISIEIPALSELEIALLFVSILYLTIPVCLTLFALSRKQTRKEFHEALVQHKKPAFQVGLISLAAYGLIIMAMQFARDVSYIVAFRQLSIPIGALLGIGLLHEARSRPKILGVGIIFAGLMMVGLG